MAVPRLFASLAILAAASATPGYQGAGLPLVPKQVSGVSAACAQLQSLFPDLLLTPESSNYTTEATDYWDLKADLSPSCIFLPTNADQVATAVRILSCNGAAFAIRGGGHMPIPGSNNIDDGVLLALNGLTDIAVDTESKTVSAGAGTRWVDVYSALSEYGLYAIGGRLKTIGVSGLTLIGGYHYFINKYGFVMDNVLSYDVVLANGTQVVANSTSNTELFWGLKGGGNNFGVVTRFVLQAIDMPLISTSVQTFADADIGAFIQASVDLAYASDDAIAAGGILTIDYNVTSKALTGQLLAVQEGSESPPSRFANFSAIPPVSTSNNVMPPLSWHSAMDTPFQTSRYQFSSHTMKPDVDQLNYIVSEWRTAVEAIADAEGLIATFVMNIVPASAAAVGLNNGIGNTWSLDANPYIIWQLSTAWSKAEDDTRILSYGKDFVVRLHEENTAKGLATEYLYAGDTGEWQDIFAGIPADNLDRMRAVRTSYDPAEVFLKLNSGGYKFQ